MRVIPWLVLAACGSEGVHDPDRTVECAPLVDGHWDARVVVPGVSGPSANITTLVRGGDDKTYAAGMFTAISGVPARSVAMWDGTAWSALGEGLIGQVRGIALADDGTLWAAGASFQGGGVPIGLPEDSVIGDYVARWNGTSWTYVMTGLSTVRGVEAVRGGIAVLGAEMPQLGASGIALFVDGVWRSAGMEQFSDVYDLARDGDRVCIVGELRLANLRRAVACRSLAVEEPWQELGTGLQVNTRAIAHGPEGWFVAGSWLVTEGNPRYGVARFDEVAGTWHSLDGGVTGANAFVSAIAATSDGVIAAGSFDRAGDNALKDLARWTPAGWTQLGPDERAFEGAINAILVEGDGAIIGGAFQRQIAESGAGIAAVAPGRVRALPPTSLAPPVVGNVTTLVATPDGIVMGGELSDADGRQALVRFADGWSVLEGVPNSANIAALPLPDGSLAVSSDHMLYRRFPDGRVVPTFAQAIDGPMYAAANGALYVSLATEAALSVIEITDDDTGLFANAPGYVTHLGAYNGELVAMISTIGSSVALRRSGDAWIAFGAWTAGITSMVTSPALGLVVGTDRGTFVWDNVAWRLLSSASVRNLQACSDGVVGVTATSDGFAFQLGFLGANGVWQAFGQKSADPRWQIAVAPGGVYVTSSDVITSTNPNTGFGRWTLDAAGW